MPRFAAIKDQQRPIRILSLLLQNGTLPHALLFTGIEGVGKQATAIALAMAGNCRQNQSGSSSQAAKGRADRGRNPLGVVDACGRCRSCRKIESGQHPDIIKIMPSGAMIKIAQIRALKGILAMKPYEARMRTVIICDAGCMNPAAGNALLKILEEPPDRTLLVLTATHTFDLPPTIVSRCQHIRFRPISEKGLAEFLVAEQGADPAGAATLAAMAGGSLTRAAAMAGSNWINRRNRLLHEIKSLGGARVGRVLALAEKLAGDKNMLPDSLEMIKAWLRDLIISKYSPEKIMNRDLAADIRRTADGLDTAPLLQAMESLQLAQVHIQSAGNPRLVLENLLLEMAKIQRRQPESELAAATGGRV